MAQERIIETGLTGPIQKDILASIMGQLSDGYWENSPRMEQYWRNADVQERDGKVVLVVRKHAFPYYAMSDDQIKQWFAKKIKFIIKEEFGKGRDVWSRTNTKQKTDWLSHKSPSQTSVSDCYYAYDTLMGRNTANKKYTAMQSTFNKLMGKKVIKESLIDRELKQAVTNTVNKANFIENVNKQQVIEDVYNFIYGKDFADEKDLDLAVTQYLDDTYGLVKQSVIKESRQKEWEHIYKKYNYDFVDAILDMLDDYGILVGERDLEKLCQNEELQSEFNENDSLEMFTKEDFKQMLGRIEESKMKKTFKHLIKEDSEFDDIHWDYNSKPQTLDEVIAKLQKAREELGNVEVAIQYRDDGGEYSGYDDSLYYWFDKKTNKFVL